MEKEKIQGLLDDFVIKNEEQFVVVARDNKPLYGAVLEALNILSVRFGTGSDIKQNIDASVAKKEEELAKILRDKQLAEDELRKIPEGANKLESNQNGLSFKEGDRFYSKRKKSQIYTIADINFTTNLVNVTWGFGGFDEKVDMNLKTTQECFEDGTYVIVPPIEKVENTPTTLPTDFKIGDKVRIKKTSRFYKKSSAENPIDLTGVVNTVFKGSNMQLGVEWSNGYKNRYGLTDLEIVSSAAAEAKAPTATPAPKKQELPAAPAGVTIDEIEVGGVKYKVGDKYDNGKTWFVIKSIDPSDKVIWITYRSGNGYAKGIGQFATIIKDSEYKNVGSAPIPASAVQWLSKSVSVGGVIVAIGDVFTSPSNKKGFTIQDIKEANNLIYLKYNASGIQVTYEPQKLMFFIEKNGYKLSTNTSRAVASTAAKVSGLRPSPSQHASDTPVGTEMMGNDGNMWKVVMAANGVKRWAKISSADPRAISDVNNINLDNLQV